MVVLEESPAALFASTTSNFRLESDHSSVGRITKSLSALRQSRASTLGTTRHALRQLSRQSELAEQSLDEARAASARRNHADRMVARDRDKFALAKAVNELESTAHALERELATLRTELDALDREDPILREAEREDGGVVLRLKVYRELGIEVVEDGAGGWEKAVVRNKSTGDVHVVAIEDHKFSPFFYANYFWNAL